MKAIVRAKMKTERGLPWRMPVFKMHSKEKPDAGSVNETVGLIANRKWTKAVSKGFPKSATAALISLLLKLYTAA